MGATGASRPVSSTNNFAESLKQAPSLLEGMREIVQRDGAPAAIRACLNECSHRPNGQRTVMYQRLALALADDRCADLGTTLQHLSDLNVVNDYYATLQDLAAALKACSNEHVLPGMYGFLMHAASFKNCPQIEADFARTRGAVVSLLNWQQQALNELQRDTPALRPDSNQSPDPLKPIKLAYALGEHTKNSAVIVEMLEAQAAANL
jgi:hypothetical protein